MRIDYSLVSTGLKDKIVNTEIVPTQWGSDHVPITLILDLNTKPFTSDVLKLSSQYLLKVSYLICCFIRMII